MTSCRIMSSAVIELLLVDTVNDAAISTIATSRSLAPSALGDS